jgi:hypothetical protein
LKLYFNKLRIPPLLHIFWDNVTLTSSVILVYNTFVSESEISLRLGKKGLSKLKTVNTLNKKLKIPYNEAFYTESFKLFYLIRMLIYDFENADFKNKIENLKSEIKKYKKKFKNAYRFYVHVPCIKHLGISKLILKLFIRNSSRYRFLDRIIFNPLTKMLIMVFYNSIKKNMPQFIDKQAMPVKNIF